MRCFWNRLSRLVEGITSRERRADYRVGFVIIERLETRGDKRSFLVDLQDYFSGVNKYLNRVLKYFNLRV